MVDLINNLLSRCAARHAKSNSLFDHAWFVVLSLKTKWISLPPESISQYLRAFFFFENNFETFFFHCGGVWQLLSHLKWNASCLRLACKCATRTRDRLLLDCCTYCDSDRWRMITYARGFYCLPLDCVNLYKFVPDRRQLLIWLFFFLHLLSNPFL